MDKKQQIAIVGIGGVFPGAGDIEKFWDNIVNGRDLTREPPPERWLLSLEDVYEQAGPLPDKVYSKRACFVEDFSLDTAGLELEDGFIQQLDPMFQLLLAAGSQAWRDGCTDGIDKKKTGIIIGNIALPTDASSALADELLHPVFERQILGGSHKQENVNRLNRYVAGLPAGILARALGLGGGSYTLDAACASSLYALKYAIDELQAGRADAMLAGGLSRPDSLYTQMGFSALHAISSSGHCSPFDHKADGLVVGEGCGMVLLKRLQDAVGDGDKIYAVVKGAGLSNDIGGNIMSPDSEGQLRAMRAAYKQAGWQPADIDLIECHGTGTPVGDVVEFNSLKSLWGDQYNGSDCVIGSVKSNIGHLLTAAGSAGLIKVLLAMKHTTLPPTANFEAANPNIDLDTSPFTILNTAREWRQREGRTPRRAAISAFGFGGINAHVLLEEWQDNKADAASAPEIFSQEPAEEIAIVGMDAAFGPWRSLAEFQQRVFGGDQDVLPEEPDNWWGVRNENRIRGYTMDRVDIPLGRFRIPPNELRDMLPQQLLMLQVAANAIEDAGINTAGDLVETGVYIGIGLDLNTTNFHVRWSLLNKAREWLKKLGLTLTQDQLNEWVARMRDAFYPPLTANRTMGALGGIVASRVARAFNVGGPSFTLSSEEASGLRAVEAGMRALQRGEINAAIAGAVDLASDLRAAMGQAWARPYSAGGEARPFDIDADGPVVGDGAAAVILKRLADAKRDGDRVYAVIKGTASASGGKTDEPVPGETAYHNAIVKCVTESGMEIQQIGYIETHGSGLPVEDRMEAGCLSRIYSEIEAGMPAAIGSSRADVGHTGAAGGLASIIKTALCLHHHIIPPLRNLQHLLPELEKTANLYAPRGRQYWLRNRSDGPRLAMVNNFSIDGNCISTLLAGSERTTGVRGIISDNFTTALFSIDGNSKTELLDKLNRLEDKNQQEALHSLACDWHRPGNLNNGELAVSLLASSTQELSMLIGRAKDCVMRDITVAEENIFYSPEPMGPETKLAFVFPGSGNHFYGMGMEAAGQWPRVLDRLDEENNFLAGQFASRKFWSGDESTPLSHTDVIFGQVWLGTMMSDVFQGFGVKPGAIIGYSLGETAGLFASRAWTDRDIMLDRIRNSTLFTRDLAGACNAARQSWGLGEEEPLEWRIGVVDCPAGLVREKLDHLEHVYLLIINTEKECVIGGESEAVEILIKELGCHFHPIDGVTTVHCDVVRPVEQAYRELHLFRTSPPEDVDFYSGILGKAYHVTTDSAADSITGQALQNFDYPKVINSAYDDGVRIFIEMGPGATCTRMIDQILHDRPHIARAVCIKGRSEVLNILRTLAHLNSERIPVDLSSLYEEQPAASHKLLENQSLITNHESPIISVPAGKAEVILPLPEAQRKVKSEKLKVDKETGDLMGQIIAQAAATETARAEAQEVYLRVANGISETLAGALSTQASLVSSLPGAGGFQPVVISNDPAQPEADNRPVFDRDMCLEFATGSIAKVLGRQFAGIDAHPTRVRLPDEPLMLVDRILAVEGEPCSMTSGRVVTEHDVKQDAWYLDGGRIPTCIAVESGQADLFLSGYLGIDLQTRGLAMYRLLDAEVTFHGPLPRAGETIHYDIHIDHFFRQGDTWLFRFRFDGTVAGRPLITMRNGCAGFFTHAELDAGQGIVLTSLEKRPMAGRRPEDWNSPVPSGRESYTDAQVNALREGRLDGCFGPGFSGLPLNRPYGLPEDRMTLVHRVIELDPDGGRFGTGIITGEADIQPDDWFLTCHFVDDRVMPGTLMYECCLHTLRIYLLRMGWVGEADEFVYEPVPEISSKLKCRGQVTETTSRVQYEITLKEYGFMPEGTPYVIADAMMYADGRAIVQMTDMSLMLSGLTKERILGIWRSRESQVKKTALFDTDSILAFATGKPSDAFGDRYRAFDNDRVIARLPGPPYQFLDRIVAIDNCEPWHLAAGGMIEAEYDVPADAWYFDQGRQPHMPFAVLLETALQPCGWLAAYLGSALTSDTDLSFRNLGGTATQFLQVTADTGTISSRIRITDVSTSGGMIIQHFDYDLQCTAGTIYRGNTYFGFFTKDALANQIGLRDAVLYQPSDAERERGRQFTYPDRSPFPKPMLRMIENITLFDPQGGGDGLGFISATVPVDPEAWFFKAHFYQDPVWPGSLGLESFIQLLKVAACHYWGGDMQDIVFESMAPGLEHSWIYRGQIIPTDSLVSVEAVISEVDNQQKLIRANGFLAVDGRIIYQMKDFALRIAR